MISNDKNRVWLFDYDLTLYSERKILLALDNRIALFVQKTLGCSAEKAQEVRKEYLQEFGTTLAGLRARHGTRPDDYFDFIHDPSTLVYPKPSPQKKNLLDSLEGPKYVFTNGRSDWSRKGLRLMGITECFRRIVGLENFGWEGKPNPSAYETMEKILVEDKAWAGKDKAQIVLIDDSQKNLRAAAERGWTTVWIHAETERDLGEIDYRLPDLMDLQSILR